MSGLEPGAFAPGAVADDVREFAAAVAAQMEGAPWPPPSIEDFRAGFRQMTASFGPDGELYESARARTLETDFDGGAVRLRVLPATESTGVYLHVHGGGWTAGSIELQDAMLERIADGAGLTAVAAEYRKAPEHPFPAALEDLERAARWLIAAGVTELGGGALAIGGDSAGANLALSTLLRLKRDGTHEAFAGANLLYGVYDMASTPSQHGIHARTGMLQIQMLEWMYGNYAPREESRRDPEVSPLYGDLRGLPPTLLTVGTEDLLLDDTLFAYSRMVAAGVDARLELYPGGDHIFDWAPLGISERSHAAVNAFLGELGSAG